MVDLLMWHPITARRMPKRAYATGIRADPIGLITSTLLPLVVVPVGFTLIDYLENKLRTAFSYH